MRKTFITLIAASSMISTQAFAWGNCKLLDFRALSGFIMTKRVTCSSGSFSEMYWSGGNAIMLMEPRDGGLINCVIPVNSINGGIDWYRVTKFACDHPNPLLTNQINLNHGGVKGIWENRGKIEKFYKSAHKSEGSELWLR